jgi:glycine cleavage system T protein (aminomethyltransferase)
VQTLLRTPLYERHVAAGARLVPFAGWEMPVQYEGVAAEHRAVRTDCGVFDVSHMGEVHVEGPHAGELLQGLLSNDLDRIDVGQAQYTLLTNDEGGILDDLIAYRLEPHCYLLVVNAANRERDYAWLKEREIGGSEVRDASDDYAMLAVQGPRALERLGLAEAPSFTFAMGELDGVECLIARTGYTGEAGVELICPAEDGPALCGLGARDTLRLEMCFPLHGNDITPETDAISAGLGWACALDKDFSGADELRRIKADGPARKLAPFVMEEKAVPRQGMTVDGGVVTSGTHSPMLDRGIGLAYVPAASAAPDTELVVDVRGRPRRARVVSKPIYRRSE